MRGMMLLHGVSTFILFALPISASVIDYPPHLFKNARQIQPRARINTTDIYGLSTSEVSDNGNHVSEFIGIRYAPKPVRFSLSEPYTLVEKDINATSFGPTCYQNFAQLAENAFNTGKPVESEDCLSINIWTPAIVKHKPITKLLPVMFWIYGGGLQFGASSQAQYNGTFLAGHDIVVVSFNYRTNVFGFPASSQLPIAESNVGFFDQRLALKVCNPSPQDCDGC